MSNKPLTKMEWFQQELAKDEYFLSEKAINSVLNGTPSNNLEDEAIDYIEELAREWDAV